MFDIYKEEQPIVYRTLINSYNNNKLSHAYLFELNGYSKGFNLAIDFAKLLLCNDDANNDKLELKIIETDTQIIKKEQLDELQKEFMNKPLNGDKKVYIIKEAEKLNDSSSNSLLKFLEEPPEGIIAILLTNNANLLLDTIVSRCQIINFKKEKIKDEKSINKIAYSLFYDDKDILDFINNTGISYIDLVIEYILNFEKNKIENIVLKNKAFLEIFNDRIKLKIAFDLMILFYKDVINIILKNENVLYNDYIDSLKFVSSNNDLVNISKKIKILVDLSSTIKYNVNSNLLMDKLIILLNEV